MIKQQKINALLLMVALALGVTPLWADDTEIYYSASSDTAATTILFMIDTSGSMDYAPDGSSPGSGEQSRMEILKDTMETLLGSLGDDTRVGLGRYNEKNEGSGWNPDFRGGRIVYPVTRLGDRIPNEFVRRLQNRNQDAYQTGAGSTISTNEDEIDFPNAGVDGGRTGFLFRDLDIPRHAVISDATLQLEGNGNSNTIRVRARYESGANLPAFDNANDLFSRSLSASHWDYTINEYWPGAAYSEIDVTDLVQDAVSQGSWCGSGDLAIVTTNFPALADSRSIDATGNDHLGTDYYPQLVIDWVVPEDGPEITQDPATSPAAYEQELMCSNDSVYLDESSDDGMQSTAGDDAGEVFLGTDELHLGRYEETDWEQECTGWGWSRTCEWVEVTEENDWVAGLIFQDIPYDARPSRTTPDVVKKAILHLNGVDRSGARSSDSATNVVVEAFSGPAALFDDNTDNDISSRSVLTTTATISVPAGGWENQHQVDVTDLVQEVLSGSSWGPDKAIGFRIDTTTDEEYFLAAREGGAVSAARLALQVSTADTSNAGRTRRDELVEAVLALEADGSTPLMESYVEAARYMMGEQVKYADGYDDAVGMGNDDTYDSPVETGTCHTSNVILLTDGAPQLDEDYGEVESLVGGTGSCEDTYQDELPNLGDDGFNNDREDSISCMMELADWLNDPLKNGSETNPGSEIFTHTISFNEDDDLASAMEKVAEEGGGMFRKAEAADDLATSFTEIVNSLTAQDASMAAPGVAVNQLNRFQFLDQLYYSVFKPKMRTRWPGNMKRYKLDFDQDPPLVVDEEGEPAVDPDSGFFKSTATSWWSNNDGNDVDKGGARGQADPDTRKLFVYPQNRGVGASNTATSPRSGGELIHFDAWDHDDIDPQHLGLADDASDDERETLYDFLAETWGDPLHSEPRLVNYGFSGSIEEALLDPSKQDNSVFVSTNDGMLHAVDAKSGEEHFTFMPPLELRKTRERYRNGSLSAPEYNRFTYGLDGSWTPWRIGNDEGQAESVYLFGGQRRGGSSYYGLDVSDRAAPRLMWEIRGGFHNFESLGDTWSDPTLTAVKVNGTRVPALVFGGGYYPEHHDDPTLTEDSDDRGNAIYIVNAFTGAKIWSASSATSADTTVSDMKWSIPGSISVVDRDLDGFADHLYAADLGGQVFRVDIDNEGNSGTGSLVERVETIAQLGLSEGGSSGIANHRRFYYAPSVAFTRDDSGKYFQLVLGSGYRAHPLHVNTDNRFYMIKDWSAFDSFDDSYSSPDVIEHSDLVNMTDKLSDAQIGSAGLDGSSGWYIELEENGEKNISSSTILENKVFMTTYLPESNSGDTECGNVIGSSRLYVLDLADASPAGHFVNDGTLKADRHKDLQLQGLPPQPQVLISGDGDGASVAVLVGTGAASGGELEGAGVVKTRWYELESEDKADKLLFEEFGAEEP